MLYLCTRKTRGTVPWMSGLVYGLQNRLRRFESARHLLLKDDEQNMLIIFFYSYGILSCEYKNVLLDNTPLFSMRTDSCCRGEHAFVVVEDYYAISTTVIPAPPKRTSSSCADLTCGTVRRYCRMSWRKIPLPVPCRMRMREAPTRIASSM